MCTGPLSQIIHAEESRRSLVHKLLTFGRLRTWKPQPLDLNKVIDDMQAILESLLGDSIRLKINLALNLCRFEGDASQIEQVILNLAVNARDAMPEGGELRIETANVDLGEQHVAASAHSLTGPYVMMAVSDTGTGMESEILDRVFEPFYTTKPVDKGSGLGLSIVYGIVEHAGGRIEVESGPGNGTTFRLYFPAQQ